MSTVLLNQMYFPAFQQLPHIEELDPNYYTEQPNGSCLPSRTWTFMGEIVNDSLSQMPILGHRVEVRDVTGQIHSVLFFPVSGDFDFAQLKAGNTLFIRYAQRCFFSDLSTEAIKVEDLNFVKVIELNLDSLLYVAQHVIEQNQYCQQCGQSMAQLGGSITRCQVCRASAFCSQDCLKANALTHSSLCCVCLELGDVFNVDFERFIDFVPFRRSE